MNILEVLEGYRDSERLAMISGNDSICYRNLWQESDRLACYLKEMCKTDKTPVIVYGHKHPYMLVAFLACVKSGRAYVPVDISVPRDRVERIIDEVRPKLILTTEPFETYLDYPVLNILTDNYTAGVNSSISKNDWVKEDDVYYIIFTSGSTGIPKGVQIPFSALNFFTEWALSLGHNLKKCKRYINQAPFSFDLSVMDLYMSLASESCLFALKKSVQTDYRQLFQCLRESEANIWVSTPSFADLCLADPSFEQALLPNMELFLFCGETLTNKTAAALAERFPGAEIFNTYGPTESTVAVTEVCVTADINAQYNPLPVGRPKPGTTIKILDGDREVADGEKGEIVIFGNTVSSGYMNRPEENSRAFFSGACGDVAARAYRTGDKGFYRDGMLFYCGRIDLQIKLHGYRMEIEDVEKNLLKIPDINQAAVVPVYEDNKVKYLKAFCVYGKPVESEIKLQKELKRKMAGFVPDYMIPRKLKFVDELPMTANGKVNRKQLQEEL